MTAPLKKEIESLKAQVLEFSRQPAKPPVNGTPVQAAPKSLRQKLFNELQNGN